MLGSRIESLDTNKFLNNLQEKDLMEIKTRVDELEEAQMKQTIALKQNLVRAISPVLSSSEVDDDKDNGTEKDNVNSDEISSPA